MTHSSVNHPSGSASETGSTSMRPGAANRLRIIVLGYIVRGPLGGLAWHHLQYVLGLAQLGHDVYFVEDSDDFPACYDPTTNSVSTDPSYGLRFAARAFRRLGLDNRWAYYDAHRSCWLGPCAERIGEIWKTAELVVNLSGVTPTRPWITDVPFRAFVDTDPVFTQIHHLQDADARQRAATYTSFFSFGENIGHSGCSIPGDGLPWRPTRQPVVLDAWPVTPGPVRGRFTTVMLWNSYPPEEYAGRYYGMKSKSFEEYIGLPQQVGSRLELTVGSKATPRPLLQSKGWILRDPFEPSRTPWTYRRYIQRSKAELSVAKHGYVVSRSGWFSERSAVYLASGRPVVTQETRFSEWLRAPGGVIPFSTLEEAAHGIEEVNSRYAFHCREARAVAEEYFDARTVLSCLLEVAMSSRVET